MAKKKTNTKKAAQPKKKTAAKKTAQDKKTQQESIVLRKFDKWEPAKLFTPKKTEFKKDFTAPRFIKGNNKKLKEILLKDFSNIFADSKAETKVDSAPVNEAKPANTSKNNEALNKKEAELKALESEIQKAKEELAKKEKEAEAKSAQAENALKDADTKLEEAKKAKDNLDAMEKDLETKARDAEAKLSEAENTKKEAESLKAEAENSKKAAEQTKADADKKSEEIKKAEEELLAKKAEIENLEKEAAQEKEKAEAKLKEAEKRENEALEKLSALEDEKKAVESEKESIKAKEEKLKAKEAELAQKEEELNKTVFTKVSESAQKISSLKPDFSKIKNPRVKETGDDNGGLMNKGILGLIAGFTFLVIILIGASISNTGNFYLKNSKDGLMVYQGKFAPKGQFHLMTLPEIYAPQDIKKESYEKKEVYSLIYSFYMDNVKQLAKSKGTPDFEKIEKNLEKALAFAPSMDEKKFIREQIQALGNVSDNYKSELVKVLEGKKTEEVKPEPELKSEPVSEKAQSAN